MRPSDFWGERGSRSNSVVAHHGVSLAAFHAQVLEPALVSERASHGGVVIVAPLGTLDRLSRLGN